MLNLLRNTALFFSFVAVASSQVVQAQEPVLSEKNELVAEMSVMITTIFYGAEWNAPEFVKAVNEERDRIFKKEGKLPPIWLLLAAESAYQSMHGSPIATSKKGAHITSGSAVSEFWAVDSVNKGSMTQKRFGIENDQDIAAFREAVSKGVLNAEADEMATKWNALEWMRKGDKDEVILALQAHGRAMIKLFEQERKLRSEQIEELSKKLDEETKKNAASKPAAGSSKSSPSEPVPAPLAPVIAPSPIPAPAPVTPTK